MSDEATNVLRQALAATQSADADQRKQGDLDAAMVSSSSSLGVILGKRGESIPR